MTRLGAWKPSAWKPLLGTWPAGAVYGTLLAAAVCALPFQIDWAEGLAPTDSEQSVLVRLRYMTVSPTLLNAERSGPVAYLHEALWLALFLGLLVGASRAVSRRSSGAEDRSGLFCLAMVAFAPLANLLVLTALELPQLVADPVLRGDRAAQLLTDAQDASPHTIVLAICGAGVASWRAARIRQRREGRAEEGGSGEEGESGEESQSAGTAAEVTTLRALLWEALAETTGPRETLWRRIGATVLATAGALVLLLLLSSGLYESVLSRPAYALCRVGGSAEICADRLVTLAEGSLPKNDVPPRLSPAYWAYAKMYALQGYAALFASVHFMVRARPGTRSDRPAAVFLVAWAGYCAGAVLYAHLLEMGERAALRGFLTWSEVPDLLSGLLIPPTGLDHTLLAAPLAAGICALFAWGRIRLRDLGARAGDASPPAQAPVVTPRR
ncbi:hypothetical protein ACIQNU_41635 [Streptomyces sp. NPDC091292]|uniref:hypothetical protein n=1 Tax=Streptomyces sp. NPDC091292 TaxID=3365991 RepID=UPI0037FB2D3D